MGDAVLTFFVAALYLAAVAGLSYALLFGRIR
jgi:hypothetical protein